MYINKNFASSTLQTGIGDVELSMTLVSGDNFPLAGEGTFIGVLWSSDLSSPALDENREIITARRNTGNNFIITRGEEDTDAKVWPAGTRFALILTAGKMVEIEDAIQDGVIGFGVTSGTPNYTLNLDPALKSPYKSGTTLKLRFANSSTGPVTLDVNGIGVKKVFAYRINTYVQLDIGDIITNMMGVIIYDEVLDTGAGGWNLISYNKALVTIVSDQEISGTKTFLSFPVLPSENPSTNQQAAHKKYVDEQAFPSGTAMLFHQASPPVGWTKKADWTGTHAVMVGNVFSPADGNGNGVDTPLSYTTNVLVSDHVVHKHLAQPHIHNVPGNNWTYDSISPAAGNLAVHKDNSQLGILAKASQPKASSSAGQLDTSEDGPTIHTVTQSTFTPKYQIMIIGIKD